jgi:hypothetical protein
MEAVGVQYNTISDAVLLNGVVYRPVLQIRFIKCVDIIFVATENLLYNETNVVIFLGLQSCSSRVLAERSEPHQFDVSAVCSYRGTTKRTGMLRWDRHRPTFHIHALPFCLLLQIQMYCSKMNHVAWDQE